MPRPLSDGANVSAVTLAQVRTDPDEVILHVMNRETDVFLISLRQQLLVCHHKHAPFSSTESVVFVFLSG